MPAFPSRQVWTIQEKDKMAMRSQTKNNPVNAKIAIALFLSPQSGTDTA